MYGGKRGDLLLSGGVGGWGSRGVCEALSVIETSKNPVQEFEPLGPGRRVGLGTKGGARGVGNGGGKVDLFSVRELGKWN